MPQKQYILLLLFSICCLNGRSLVAQDSLLQVLDKEIEERPIHLAKHIKKINKLQAKLNTTTSPTENYYLRYQLCALYESFSYDSAFAHVEMLIKLAHQINEEEKIVRAKTKQSFIFLSAGFFGEAIDSLRTLPYSHCSDSTKAYYFLTLARSHFNFADFFNNPNSSRYNEKGLMYLDSAIFYARYDSLAWLSNKGLRALKRHDVVSGIAIYQSIVQSPRLSERQSAIEFASMGDAYLQAKQEDQVLAYLIRSAIADERSCVKENTALLRTAHYLYKKGDLERASNYINIALEDANFYGARHRKIQILEVLPIIKAQQYALIETKRDQLIFFTLLLTALLGVCIYLIWSHIQQNKRLKTKAQTITLAYQKLEQYAAALNESQHIKEKYVGFFFQSNTKLINKIQTIFKNASKELAEGKYQEAKLSLSLFKDTQEKKKLLRDFDLAFLSIFPNFIEQFNQFFEEKDMFTLNEEGMLNTEIRIYAFIRLGITNNEVIAKALGYSVNTIYAYKTKIRNKSIFEGEEFDDAVMKIK